MPYAHARPRGQWDSEDDSTHVSEFAPFSARAHSFTESTIEEVEATLEQIDAVLRRVRSVSNTPEHDSRNLGVLVRLTAGWLEGLDSGEVAQLLKFNDAQYRQVLHGQLRVQPSKARHLEAVAEIVRELLKVLEPDAVGQWFRTPVPALGGRTPFEAVRKRRDAAVLRVVRGYLDPSYA